MKSLSMLLLLLAGALGSSLAQEVNTMTFKADDGLTLTADVYNTGRDLPWILLCHQAGYSRGEYQEIAPKLNKLGFNCVALDARSGEQVNNVRNVSAAMAKREKKPTTYADAEQDIVKGIQFAYKMARGKPIILWGSSYSAALVCKLGAGNDQVSKVIAFSPGEYIKGQSITDAVRGMDKPLFVTSSKSEAKDVAQLTKAVSPKLLVQFVPEQEGKHGSKALWNSTENNREYWEALKSFLGK